MSDTETTVISRHTFIKGELHLQGPTVIGGRVEGTVVAEEALEIAADGIIEGDIHGLLVDIQGTVKGNVIATRACRLGASARVSGELRAANLAIAEGACFVGQVYVGGGAQQEEPDATEEISAAQTMTGAINRLESMAAEAQEVAEETVAQPVISAGPTVRIVSQTVQQTLHRSPKIIKAR